jgi:hypothetical protein
VPSATARQAPALRKSTRARFSRNVSGPRLVAARSAQASRSSFDTSISPESTSSPSPSPVLSNHSLIPVTWLDTTSDRRSSSVDACSYWHIADKGWVRVISSISRSMAMYAGQVKNVSAVLASAAIRNPR